MLKILFLVVSIVAAISCYETRYDNVDLDEILQSDRLLTNYVKCLLDEGPCTPDGMELKSSIPDAIQSDCSHCTEKQKFGADKVNHFLIDNKPDIWDRLSQLYDPEGVYKSAYLDGKPTSNPKMTIVETNED